MNNKPNQHLKPSFAFPLLLIGAVMASGTANASPNDGVVFLDVDRKDDIWVGHMARNNQSSALFQWDDVTSLVRSHRLPWMGASSAAAIQSGYIDQGSGDIEFKASVMAKSHDAFARSSLSYEFEVTPLSDRDCTSHYGGDSALESVVEMSSDSWGSSRPMSSARLSLFYDVRYEGLGDLEIEGPSGVGVYVDGSPVLESNFGFNDSDWYLWYLEPGNYSIDVNAEILALNSMFRGSTRSGSCEIDLSFKILEGPGWADSTLLDVDRSASAGSGSGSVDLDESDVRAGGELTAAKASPGCHANATEESDATGNALWGHHTAEAQKGRWSTISGSPQAMSITEYIFEVPGSSFVSVDGVIFLEGWLARQGAGDGTVTIEILDDSGRQRLEYSLSAVKTQHFTDIESYQRWTRDFSLSPGEYTVRITSEADVPSASGISLVDHSAQIDCSFAMILN